MKRALILVAPAILVLGLAACGDDDETPDTTAGADTTTDTDDTVTVPDLSISVPDITIPDITIPDISLPAGVTMPDISMPDLSDVSLPGNFSEIMGQIFPNLDEEQIECLVEHMDGGNLDPSAAMELVEDCNIDPADLSPAG